MASVSGSDVAYSPRNVSEHSLALEPPQHPQRKSKFRLRSAPRSLLVGGADRGRHQLVAAHLPGPRQELLDAVRVGPELALHGIGMRIAAPGHGQDDRAPAARDGE